MTFLRLLRIFSVTISFLIGIGVFKLSLLCGIDRYSSIALGMFSGLGFMVALLIDLL